MKRYIRCSSDNSISEKVIAAWQKALDYMNISSEDVHLLSYNEGHNLERSFMFYLREAGADLSYKSDFVKYNGIDIKIGGNAQGIASDFIKAVVDSQWHAVEVNEEEAYEKLAEAPNIYTANYWFVEPISYEEGVRMLNLATGSFQHGYGSQAYIDEVTRTIYEDDLGNVKVKVNSMRWD